MLDTVPTTSQSSRSSASAAAGPTRSTEWSKCVRRGVHRGEHRRAGALMSTRTKVHIGVNLTKGLGAGADPDVGFQAAEENRGEERRRRFRARTWCS